MESEVERMYYITKTHDNVCAKNNNNTKQLLLQSQNFLLWIPRNKLLDEKQMVQMKLS